MICTSSSRSVAPSITIAAATNYNQNSAVFNGTINNTGNRDITSVEFRYSTNAFMVSPSAWFTATVNPTVSQGSTAVTCSYQTGTILTPSVAGTPSDWYTEFRVTNSSGFVTTSGVSAKFTTYRERTDQFTTSGVWTNPKQTSDSNGKAIDTLNQVVVVGGGGAADWGGGAGGNLAVYNNIYLPGMTTFNVTIGGGGSYASTSGGSATVFGLITGAGGAPANYNIGGASNGRSGGQPSSTGGGGTPAGGGGAGIGSNGYTAVGSNGGNGGDAFFGLGGGGGGSPEFFGSFGTAGTPTGNGPAGTGRGGASDWNIIFAGGSTGNGGSGYCDVKYWGPY